MPKQPEVLTPAGTAAVQTALRAPPAHFSEISHTLCTLSPPQAMRPRATRTQLHTAGRQVQEGWRGSQVKTNDPLHPLFYEEMSTGRS